MYLLNASMIEKNNKAKDGLLDIQPLENTHLCPTYYYFSLGPQYRRWNRSNKAWELGELEPGNEVLDIHEEEFVLIQSQERFRCSKQCFAIFGQSSGLIRKGLSLRNSPFIDPNFPDEVDPGYLEIGLKNELNITVKLRLGDSIGKICFFNVSDTYPISDVAGSASEEDYSRRSRPGPPVPKYDDHPVEGWQDVEDFGKDK